MHLYLYDASDDRLRALDVSGAPGSEGWAPGTGATGTAYELGEYVLVTGDAVYDATYGLSPEQQESLRDLAVVAAMPVTNATGDVIGVLTAASSDPDAAIASPGGFEAQVLMAQMIARVLVDISSGRRKRVRCRLTRHPGKPRAGSSQRRARQQAASRPAKSAVP